MTLACVTNAVPGMTPCVVRGSHFAACDGWEYRDTREGELSTGKPCPGCVPRDAKQGHLCWTCWDAVRDAINDSHKYMTTIAGAGRLIQRDNGGVRGTTEGGVPLPVTALILDELNSYLASYGGNSEVWVSSFDGAADAIRFARAFKSAVKNHPIEEKPHRIRRARCPECKMLTLAWFPPTDEGADVHVKCRTEGCGFEVDQDKFDELADIMEAS